MKYSQENVRDGKRERVVLNIDRCLGTRGVKSAYTAQEFRRFFRAGFGRDFVKETTLSRAVETFLDEREQSFALFEYAVDLINEVRLDLTPCSPLPVGRISVEPSTRRVRTATEISRESFL